MCDFVPDDIMESPNRVDALVWVLTYLVASKLAKAGTWGRKREKVNAAKRERGVKTRTYKVKAFG